MRFLPALLHLVCCFAFPVRAQVPDDLPTFTLPEIGAGPALIIAVDKYDGGSAFSDLPGIEQDATAVKATLMRLGFAEAAIRVLRNPSQQEMRSAMDSFGEEAAASSKASFFYFTGHGVLMDGKNYLVPAHAPIRVQGHLPTYAVPIEHVLDYLGGEDSGPALVFVDACRNNSLPRTAKSASSPLMHLERQAGLFIGYATGEGRISNASTDGSVFTASLCRRLLTPGRSVDDLYAGVIHDVQKETADLKLPQDPQKQSGLRFVFYLVPESTHGAGSTPASLAPVRSGGPATPSGAADLPPPPLEVKLPPAGYFDLDSIFDGTPYDSFNQPSRTAILKQAQAQLKGWNLYRDTVDGGMGPGTQQAIVNWQRRQKLPLSGKLDNATLASLELLGMAQIPLHRPAVKPSATRVPPTTAPRSAQQTKPVTPAPAAQPPAQTEDDRFREATRMLDRR